MAASSSSSSPPSTLVMAEEGGPGVRGISAGVAERWREIQGERHWEGLLDPLDLELRRSILRYGDFNQAVYDAFDNEPHSKYTGTCRFAKEDFFSGTGLETQKGGWGYEVTRYLYGTSSVDIPKADFILKSLSREAWSKESNWIGYVAISTDEATKRLGRRDIVIVWRGTMRNLEWADDFLIDLTDLSAIIPPSTTRSPTHWYDQLLHLGDSQPMVERGWMVIYTSSSTKSPYTSHSARDQVLNEVKCLVRKYRHEEISITTVGHSLGAALAIINAFDITENGLNLGGENNAPFLVTAIVFGCPGVGNDDFKDRCDKSPGLRILRVRNFIDLLVHFPSRLAGYKRVGEELMVDSRKSSYLKDSKNPGDWHNLEAHLHLVAGTQGPDKPFELVVNRDIALVNKSCEFLRDDYLIPGSWWQIENKGLVQREDGVWFMPDRSESNIPKPEPLNDVDNIP